MTVGELVELLQAYPAGARVVVDGYEGGHDEPHVVVQRVVLGDGWPWGGEHDTGYCAADGSWRQDEEAGVHCVVVSRDDFVRGCTEACRPDAGGNHG